MLSSLIFFGATTGKVAAQPLPAEAPPAEVEPVPPDAAGAAPVTAPPVTTPPSAPTNLEGPSVQGTAPSPPASAADAASANPPVPEPEPEGEAERGRVQEPDREGATRAPERAAVSARDAGDFQLKGRVFVLAELEHRQEDVVGASGNIENRERNSLDLSLGSARVGLEYQSPLPWLSAEVELELAKGPEVKDAYLHAGKRFFARAGQFKMPSANLELESAWTLPLGRRGFVHDLLTDWLDVAGRRPGLVLGYRGKGGVKPRITFGAFQGTVLQEVVPGDRDVELIEKTSLHAQTFAARAQVEILDVELGGWYEHRVGSPDVGETHHYATFGLDAKYDQTFQSGGLRLWLDGTTGESFYVHEDKPGQDEEAIFVAARALAGYRFGGTALGDPYLEPFGYFAALDPDSEVVADFALEAAFGLNVGFWDRARLTLQGEVNAAQRNFPSGYLGGQEPDRIGLLLQAGARF
ncbi:MAG TPA: hypothetical protein VFU02_13080 [Polyangiaceae bacterium]|nr:hypothetical protein [Polyangiaceae bacterium]